MNACRKLLWIGLLLAAGCSPISQASPTALPLPSSTPTAPPFTPTLPVSTSSATPTPTPDAAQAQLELLYRSSLKYLAATNAETVTVARSLDVSPGMTGRSVCGPLAFAILRDAGLVGGEINLHDYWFLNPAEDAHILERTFPRKDFEWMTVTQAINAVDYSSFPLRAGDLLFIYSGKGGDYSHVLVVTRLDEAGRAYAVTNNYTDDGFVIQEYLLYDPARPGEGIFYAWTDPANARLGLTGFGGFNLWRPRALPYQADAADR